MAKDSEYEYKYSFSTDRIGAELKGKIIGAFETEQMRRHVDKIFSDYPEHEISDILYCARMPLEEKALLFEELAKLYPEEKNKKTDEGYDFVKHARMFRSAVENMKYNETEQAVYILVVFNKDETSPQIFQEYYVPFRTFDAAVRRILEETENRLNEALEWDDIIGWHFVIEKWIPAESGEMKHLFDYEVLPDGTVTCAEDEADTFDAGFMGAYWIQLYAALPFLPGDIVKMDCRPYAPEKYCIVLQTGRERDDGGFGRWDCCFTRCLYFDSSKNKLEESTMKHLHFFDDYFLPHSPLFRAEVYTGELPESEAFLTEVSKVIKESDKSEWTFSKTVSDLVEAGVQPNELAEKLREKLQTLQDQNDDPNS